MEKKIKYLKYIFEFVTLKISILSSDIFIIITLTKYFI